MAVATTTRIDLGLSNSELYQGVTVEQTRGGPMLTTPAADAAPIIARNARAMAQTIPPGERGELVLHGSPPTWATLVAFHALSGLFGRVSIETPGGPVVITGGPPTG